MATVNIQKVYDTIAHIDLKNGGDVTAHWVIEDLGFEINMSRIKKITKMLKKKGYTDRGRFWFNKDRMKVRYRRGAPKSGGEQYLTLFRKQQRQMDYPKERTDELKRLLAEEYKTVKGFEVVDEALKQVTKMSGLQFRYSDFAAHHIYGDDLQRARYSCLEHFSRLENYNGLPHLTIAHVIRKNLERQINNGGNPSVRDVYNILLNFENAFYVAVGDWNSITKMIVEKITEADVIQPFEGMKDHKNPLKFKDSEDWFWGGVLKKALPKVRKEIYTCRPPFEGSFDRLIETTEGRVHAKRLHKWIKTTPGIKDERYVSAAIINAFRKNIVSGAPHPTDDKVLNELLEDGEWYANYGSEMG